MAKVLLIGQAPSRSGGRDRAFDGDSGKRLARYLQMDGGLAELFEHFDTVNLLSRWPGKHAGRYAYRDKGDRFPIAPAMRRAGALERVFSMYPVVVFAGRKVARAFRYDFPFLNWFDRRDGGLGLVIPHPSGCNLLYNDGVTQHAMRKCLRGAMKLASARLPRTLEIMPTRPWVDDFTMRPTFFSRTR